MSSLPAPAPVERRRVADQIVEDLRTQILEGKLPDGSKLPSERVLAAHYDESNWGRVSDSVAEMRVDIANAIAEHDGIRAVSLVREYHRRVIEHIQSLPRAQELAATDPGLSTVLARWLNQNIGLATQSQ